MMPRNILLFLTDDHARWALPSYGNPAVAMPNLDRLAAVGTVFDDAYTTSPVCSPARASLMTGLLPSEHGIHDFLGSRPQFDAKDWLDGVPTLAEKLRGAGYWCALAGKWHVARDAHVPRGFDRWLALNGEYPIHHDGDNGFTRDGTEERVHGNLTDAITDRALNLIGARDPDRPFFLTVGYYATHSPWQDQPKRLVDRYLGHDFAEIGQGAPAPGLVNPETPGADPQAQHRARAEYYAAVSHIDEGIGKIVAALSAAGVLDDTLIVYTADHGLCLGQHGIWGKGNATRPQNLLDENVRVPLILSGPGVAEGVRQSGFVDHRDTHFRILQAAGQGQRPFPPHRDVQVAEYGTLRMARDSQHKLLVRTDGTPMHLVEVGPGKDETRDVSGQPGADQIIARLADALRDAFANMGEMRPDSEALKRGTYNFNQAWDPFVPL